MPDAEKFANTFFTGMEVFRPGTYHGKVYTEADLMEMEENFKKLQGKVVPKIKITHGEDQVSIAGLASYGDVVNLYTQRVDGELKLYANVEGVPEQVKNWVSEKRFTERSIELYRELDVEGQTYKNVLVAVALLGHELPAVPGMEKIAASKDAKDIVVIKCNLNENQDGGDSDMKEIIEKMQAEIEKLQAEKAELEKKSNEQEHKAEVEQFKARITTLETEITSLKSMKEEFSKVQAEKEELKAKVAKAEEDKKVADKKAKSDMIGSVYEKFAKKGVLVPAVEKQFRQLCESLDDNLEIAKFTVAEDGKSVEKGYSQLKLMFAIVETLSSLIKFGEKTAEGGDSNVNDTIIKHGADSYKTQGDEVLTLAREIQAKEKVTLAIALEKASAQLKAEGKK